MIPKKIVIHCTATPNGKYIPFEEVKRWHTDPPPKGRGWKDIGYHVLINVNGEIHFGRPYNEEGAHVSGHNADSLGICLVGSGKYSREQLESLSQQLRGIMMTYHDIPYWAIYCHNQFDSAQKQGKTCPNMEVNRLLAWALTSDWKAMEPYLLEATT